MSTIQPKQTAFRASTWLQLPIVVLVLLVSLYVAVSPPNRLLNWYNNDDGFYYFVVARNIAGGAGVTFDGVNPANGFHPLWMMICIPIFAVFNSDPLLPLRVIVLVFGVFQAAAMLLLFDMLAKKLPLLLSCLLTLLFGLAPSLYSAILSGGLESGLGFFMIFLLIWLVQKSRAGRRDLLWLAIAGLAAGLTVLSRLDSIFTVAFLGLWCIFDRTEDSVQILTDIIAACIIVMLSAGIRLGFNLLYFDRTVLSLIILWAALGALGGFLNGLYSYKPFPIKTRPILRTLLIHAALTAVIAAVSWLLAKTGLLETWSRAVLVYSSAGWLLYTLAKQFLLRNRRSLSDTPARMPIASAFWHWVKKPLAWYLPVAVLLGGYMAWSQAKFGTPTPVSGQIKVWWGSLGITVYGSPIHSFQELFQFLFGKGSPFFYLYEALNPVFAGLKTAPVRAGMFSWGLLVLGFLALLVVGQKNRLAGWLKDLAVLPLTAGILLRLIYFFVTGYVHFRKWYW
ncbi:MAG: hypothetical protein AAGU05_07035, partial [Anaerolineaceae bacterium]